MQLLIVTFNLRGVSDSDYRRSCEEEAPAFASVPGLVSKSWLADEATNTYGGVYSFADQRSMDTYVQSDLFKAIVDDPTVVNLKTRTFDILEGPSRITRAVGDPAVPSP